MKHIELCSQYEVFQVTEFRDGCVFGVENTGILTWIPIDASVFGRVYQDQNGAFWTYATHVDFNNPGSGIKRRTDWIDPNQDMTLWMGASP